MNLRPLLALIATGCLAAGAFAQDVFDDGGGVETRLAAEAAIAAASDAGQAVYALRLEAGANLVLESGLEIGVAGVLGVQEDDPLRHGFSADLGPDTGGASLRGAFSGLGRGAAGATAGPRGEVEAAYMYVLGGYGEARLGRDQGIAARFHEGGPSLFRRAGLDNPAIDPTGQAFIRTDHDLTGPAVKLSYATPRLLGLRAGVSFTPEADVRGLDRDPARTVAGIVAPQVTDAFEGALNLSRRLPQSGVRLRAGLAFSRADAAAAAQPGAFSPVETWSGGGSVGFETLTIGASALRSNNGAAGIPGDYEAWTVSAVKAFPAFEAGLAFGGADDDLAGLRSQAWSIGAAKTLIEGVRVAAEWRDQDTRVARLPAGALQAPENEAQGVVIEITLSR